MATNGKFNKKEKKAFAPGGSLSTEKQRLTRPRGDFLDSANRKYPFKVGGKVSCDLLRAAQVRAKQNGHDDIAARAKAMFDKTCGA